MKILILQLARFGDILMTGPVLKALRRQHPHAEIHLLARTKFHEACLQLEGFDKLHLLSTADLIGPMLETEMNEAESMERGRSLVEKLRAENFQEIINLTFSPSSSWLTKLISTDQTFLKGYSRYSDGSFRICDEASEYFYAQVGVGQHNRFHLINMLGTVAGVDIKEEDTKISKIPTSPMIVPKGAIALHIGASQEGKRIPTLKWTSLIREFSELNPETPILLLGSGAEKAEAETIASSSAHAHLYNYVGKTTWADVFAILAKCTILIAGDSSLIQASNLVGLKSFNISNSTVNFWETGPRTIGSAVYHKEDFDMLDTRDVANLITAILAGNRPPQLFYAVEGLPAFDGPGAGDEFQWALIAALYWGMDFPQASSGAIEAIKHLKDLNDVVLENLGNSGKIDPGILTEILRRADEIQALICQQLPSLKPLFKFFEVERIRISPGSRAEIIQGMIVCHERCSIVLQAFLEFQQKESEMTHGQL